MARELAVGLAKAGARGLRRCAVGYDGEVTNAGFVGATVGKSAKARAMEPGDGL